MEERPLVPYESVEKRKEREQFANAEELIEYYTKLISKLEPQGTKGAGEKGTKLMGEMTRKLQEMFPSK